MHERQTCRKTSSRITSELMRWQGALAVEREHDHMQPSLLRTSTCLQTLIAGISTRTPLLALGTEVPAPQSLGEVFGRRKRRASRHHPADESCYRNPVHIDPPCTCTCCAQQYGPPQAPLTVSTVSKRAICEAMITRVRSRDRVGHLQAGKHDTATLHHVLSPVLH